MTNRSLGSIRVKDDAPMRPIIGVSSATLVEDETLDIHVRDVPWRHPSSRRLYEGRNSIQAPRKRRCVTRDLIESSVCEQDVGRLDARQHDEET